MPIVSNATPLIALSRIGRLDLLRDLFREVVVPPEVYDELVVRGEGRPGSDVIAAAGWVRRQDVKDSRFVADLMAQGLGRGEAEAIALARETGCTCLTDDSAAIAAGGRSAVPVRRTLSALLAAKTTGAVTSLREVMDELRSSNFWIDDATYGRVLRLAGE